MSASDYSFQMIAKNIYPFKFMPNLILNSTYIIKCGTLKKSSNWCIRTQIF